jgi:DNA-binding NarL/FixJ family response regulator
MDRIVIVDDHPGFRAWAAAMLAADGFEVVGEAVDGASAIERVRAARPDVVLLDVQLPDTDGFVVAGALLAGPTSASRAAIVLTSSRDAGEYAAELVRARLPFIAKEDLSGPAIRLALADRP